MNSTIPKKQSRNLHRGKARAAPSERRLAPAGAWLRNAVRKVRRDIAEVKAGRKGFLKTYSVDELFLELHSLPTHSTITHRESGNGG